MKKLMILSIAVVCLATASCNKQLHKPIGSYENRDSASAHLFRLHQIIVIYKKKPTQATVNTIKALLAARPINPINIDSLTVKKCNKCNEYIELWEAKNIHTTIEADGIAGGTVSDKSKGVGEDGLAHYSLNFFNSIPMDKSLSFTNFSFNGKVTEFSSEGKKVIKVAVLDTGIDTKSVISPSLHWKNPDEKTNGRDDDGNCYVDDTHGWNFIDNNSDVAEDNINFHGTLVSHYIINEFALSTTNFVQIMSLKTHDEDGVGDLFTSICALHYAIDKKVNIINASWGFYYYNDAPHPYLDKLITKTMRKNGILFVTAAGNKDDKIDASIRDDYRDLGVEVTDAMLRNLEYHSFYPACLSQQGKNVVTVTTTDGTLVSPTQNYSEQYVDIGVLGDVNDTNAMKFTTPFTGPVNLISGSSFATAIACGKIGAYFPESMYQSGLNKDAVFEQLQTATPAVIPPLIIFKPAMESSLIKDGKMTHPK